MPISYEWMQGQVDIIRVIIDGAWGWDEFFVRHHEYVDAAVAVGRRVDFIMDFSTASGVVPPGVFKGIQELAKISRPLYKPRLTVFVFRHSLFRTVIVTFMKLNPAITRHYRIVDSVDEALKVIEKGRETEKEKQ
jgi:hypothetical protein